MPTKVTKPNRPKILVVVGPTASGKSELAVKLAKQRNGEILSVDSRQIYRGMDLGTGKVPGKWQKKGHRQVFVYKGVPHYGIDIASPKRQYSAAQFQKYAERTIADILSRGKLPILCGGTAHWVDAIVYDQQFPKVKPDAALRNKLDKLSADQLFKKLKRLDPKRAASIDPHNPRRLIRALEIVLATGKPVQTLRQESKYDPEWIGIKLEPAELQKRIHRRLLARIKQGMFHEVQTLHKQAISWQKLWNFGLEYRWVSQYLQKKMTRAEALAKLETEIWRYSKRQLTWWKRNKKIKWMAS